MTSDRKIVILIARGMSRAKWKGFAAMTLKLGRWDTKNHHTHVTQRFPLEDSSLLHATGEGVELLARLPERILSANEARWLGVRLIEAATRSEFILSQWYEAETEIEEDN